MTSTNKTHALGCVLVNQQQACFSSTGSSPATQSSSESLSSVAPSQPCQSQLPAPGATGPLNFSDHSAVFAGRPTSDLIRSYLVLQACSFEFISDKGEQLVAVSRKVRANLHTCVSCAHTLLTLRLLAILNVAAYPSFGSQEDFKKCHMTTNGTINQGVGILCSSILCITIFLST